MSRNGTSSTKPATNTAKYVTDQMPSTRQKLRLVSRQDRLIAAAGLARSSTTAGAARLVFTHRKIVNGARAIITGTAITADPAPDMASTASTTIPASTAQSTIKIAAISRD